MFVDYFSYFVTGIIVFNCPAGKVRVIPRSNADSAEIRNLTRDSAE